MIRIFDDEGCIQYLDDLIELNNRCFPESKWDKTTWEKIISRGNFVLGLFFNKKEILAYILITIVLKEAELFKIGVCVNNRNLGIAHKLLVSSINELNKRHVEVIFLEVRADNGPAIKFYKKHGFQKVGLRKQYYHSPECDGHIYSKRLA